MEKANELTLTVGRILFIIPGSTPLHWESSTKACVCHTEQQKLLCLQEHIPACIHSSHPLLSPRLSYWFDGVLWQICSVCCQRFGDPVLPLHSFLGLCQCNSAQHYQIDVKIPSIWWELLHRSPGCRQFQGVSCWQDLFTAAKSDFNAACTREIKTKTNQNLQSPVYCRDRHQRKVIKLILSASF